jgi:predicted amidohydrolase
MIIVLASPHVASTLDKGLDKIKRLLSEASARGAEIVCFPEAYLPGLRGQDFEVFPYGQEGVLVQAINVEEATGLLATRYAPERYQEYTLGD